jgi:hypothetical protein
MKREHQRDRGFETRHKSGAASVKLDATADRSSSYGSGSGSASPGHGAGGAAVSPAGGNPPRPQWARYVDSRLKQFCAR